MWGGVCGGSKFESENTESLFAIDQKLVQVTFKFFILSNSMRFLHEFWSQSRGKRKPHVLWSGSYPVDLPTGPAVGTGWRTVRKTWRNMGKYLR